MNDTKDPIDEGSESGPIEAAESEDIQAASEDIEVAPEAGEGDITGEEADDAEASMDAASEFEETVELPSEGKAPTPEEVEKFLVVAARKESFILYAMGLMLLCIMLIVVILIGPAL